MRVLTVLVTSLLVLYLAAVGLFSTAWFNRMLLERAQSALAQVTGARVEIGQMLVQPWTVQVTLRSLVLRGNETASELPLFAAREAVVRPSLSAILRRRLRLRRLDLEGAEIHLYTRPDGSTNLPGPQAAGSRQATLDRLLDLAVRELVIAHSDLYWDDRRVAIDAAARNVAILLGFRQGRYMGTASASDLSLARSELRSPPVTFSTRIELAPNALALTSIIWRSKAIDGAGRLTLHWLPAIESQFSFQAEGEAGRLANLVGWNEIGQGRFTVESEGTYRSGEITAHGRLQARQLQVSSQEFRPGPLDLAANYSLAGHRLALSSVTASVLGAMARGQAEVLIAKPAPRFAADFDLQQLDAARALRAVPNGQAFLTLVPIASRVGGKIQVSGNGRVGDIRTRFDFSLEAPASVSASQEPVSGQISGTVSLSPGRPPAMSIDVETALLRSSHSTLTARGTMGQASSSLTLQVETTDYGEWRKAMDSFSGAPIPIKLDSAATFSGTVSGLSSEPTVQGKLRMGAFEYQGWKWTGLEANVLASPKELQVSSGRLLGPHSVLQLDLAAGLENWQFTADSPLKLSAGAEKTSIEGLREALGMAYPVTGSLTGTLTLEGRRSQLAGRGTFRIQNGSYRDEPFDSVTASLSVETGVWNVTDLELFKGQGHLTGTGSYDPGARTFSGKARARGFSLSDLHSLRTLRPTAMAASPFDSLKGQLDFDLEGRGNIDSPSVRGTVTMTQVTTGALPLGDLTARLEWSGSRGTIQGQLRGPGGAVDFHGEDTARGEWPLELSAQYTGLRLDPWLRSFGLNKLKAAVDASGSIDLSAPFRGSAPVQFKSQVEKLEVSFPELRWQNDKPFTIGLENRRLTISPFHLQGPSTQFQLQGAAVFSQPTAVDLTAQGEINASLLRVLEPALQTAGYFDAELRVRGTVGQPSLYGSLHVHDVGLAYPGVPLRLAGLNGDIRLEGDHLAIQSLNAVSGPSSVSISGSMTLSGTPRYNLRADLSHVRVQYPPQFTSVLSGSVRFSGTPSAGVANGDVTVTQMFVSENFNILNWISQLASQTSAALPSGPSPLASAMRLDVHVATAPVVTIESRDLNVVAAIDLALRGTLADPVAFGSAHIESGQAVLRQTTYTISRGDITLANPSRTQPTLDLEAKTRIQRYDITLKVTGPADRPSVLYRSDPPLTTPEILALLAFGYTSQDQLIGTSGSSTIGTQGASALLSQALSSQASSRITRLFGLSRVSIDPNPSSLGGARLTVEERLTRDFAITYVTTTGTVQERIIQVEWDLTDAMSLLGVRDQNGVYGLELDFRKRFK
jgi:translocation and assembly module TamB